MTINVFGGGNSSAPVFPVQRSVRLRSSASAYFNRTFTSSGTDLKRWTLSFWIKRGTLGVQSVPFSSQDTPGTGAASLYFLFSTSNTFAVFYPNTATTLSAATTAVFRDTSSWYHFVVTYDSTQATNTDRIKIYVNGVQQALSSPVYPSLNATTTWNSNCAHFISKNPVSAADYLDGYITEINSIDGQALTPTSFGSYNSTTGVWQPIKYSGTYGTNGFYLNFQDNSGATATTIGKDSSGNGNNWTPNNISVTAGVTYDSMLDVPTLTSNTNANFATLNSLSISGAPSITEGNLTAAATAAAYAYTVGTQRLDTQIYFEATLVAAQNGVAGNAQLIGISNAPTLTSGFYIACDNGASLLYSYVVNGGAKTSLGITPANGDILMFAYDTATGKIWAGRNGTWFLSGNPSAGTSPIATLSILDYFPWVGHYSTQPKTSVNFGQRPFTYTPPTGFKSLNTYNLPTPTIPNGAAYMAATTYTGTGAALSVSNAVNSVSFQPDFVWVKGRSGATDHALYDSVRGATKQLESNTTTAETTEATGLTAFGSSGFTVGALAKMNTNTATYVGWQWKGGGTAVTNTSGSITSSVSANPSAGFSIVTYTGTGANATVGHGLGIAPKMVIVKSRNNVGSIGYWAVWHTSIPNTDYLLLQTTDAKATSSLYWNSTSPTSTVFSLGAGTTPNASTSTYVAYCFSEIAGYSKFGSYTGNGSTDGVFVYTGFRPRFVLVKSSSAVEGWVIWDSARDTYNAMPDVLYPNLSNAEGANTQIDFLSNGFKLRNSATNGNITGVTYIYAAFAESPFNYSLAR